MMSRLRKRLGRIKRGIFRSKAAYWYFKPLFNNVCGYIQSEPDVGLDLYSFAETKQWIINKTKRFPWIYSIKELDCAEKNGHLFPSLRYRGEIIGFVKVALN